mmetsp:Transcript_11566/g.32579  ORF Transcript_11566/g.32579 Transcript_11566/m.32579 type:complete len:227 (+) Transcript_11566:904-1584(+)
MRLLRRGALGRAGGRAGGHLKDRIPIRACNRTTSASLGGSGPRGRGIAGRRREGSLVLRSGPIEKFPHKRPSSLGCHDCLWQLWSTSKDGSPLCVQIVSCGGARRRGRLRRRRRLRRRPRCGHEGARRTTARLGLRGARLSSSLLTKARTRLRRQLRRRRPGAAGERTRRPPRSRRCRKVPNLPGCLRRRSLSHLTGSRIGWRRLRCRPALRHRQHRQWRYHQPRR